MLKLIKRIIVKIEDTPTSFSFWLISFLSIIAIRILIESWTGGILNKTAGYFFHHIAYTFLFFTLSYFIFLGILQKFFKITFAKASNIMLVGYLIIFLPPLVDYILLKDKLYMSFYGIYGLSEMPKRFLMFFGSNPDFGITYGVRTEIALTVLFLFIYGYVKTNKKKLRSALLALSAYMILFVLATFPSWITILVKGSSIGFFKVSEVQIVQMFLTPARLFSRNTGSYFNALSIKLSLIYALLIIGVIFLGLFLNYRDKLFAFLKNIRPIQIIYHLGLLFIGAGLGIKFTTTTWDLDFFNTIAFLNIIMAIILTWTTSAIVNDIADQKVDVISNKKRPLVAKKFSKQEYIIIGSITFFFSLLLSAIVNPKVAMLLVAYQALAWIYSAQPLRFKRIPILATAISAIASLLIFIAGYILVVPTQDISQLPSQILWLIFISLTLSLPIKDLKDIAGDKQNGIKTIPVIFGKYWGKIIISSGIFISYVLSVIFLNETKLLWWAILFGGISFWMVVSSGQIKKITNRNVIGWIMCLVAIYVLVVAKVIFLS